MLNILLIIGILIAFAFGAVGTVSTLASLFEYWGISLIPPSGYLEFLVAKFEAFKFQVIVPELIEILSFFDIGYQPWMADVLTVYYYLSFGLTLLLFFPESWLVQTNGVLGATASLIKSVPAPIRLPILLLVIAMGPVFLVLVPLALIVAYLMTRFFMAVILLIGGLIAGIVFFPIIGWTILAILLVVGIFFFAPILAAIIVYVLAYMISAMVKGGAEAAEGALQSRGLSFASFAAGIFIIIPASILIGSAFVLVLILTDLIWVFGILKWIV